MRIRTLPARTAALAGAAALLLSACGSGGNGVAELSGPEAAERAADALREAGSATVTGSFEADGESGDLDLHVQGEDAIGTVGLAGQTVELLVADGRFYMQAAADFWAAFGLPPEFADGLDGQWVLVPDEAGEGFGEFTLESLAEEVASPTDETIEEEVTTGERDGEPVVVVSTDTGGTLTVAGEGPAYPLEIESTGADAGTITFSRFGEQEEISAPADAVDLADIGG